MSFLPLVRNPLPLLTIAALVPLSCDPGESAAVIDSSAAPRRTAAPAEGPSVQVAVARLWPVGDSQVSGTVRFESHDGKVHVSGEVAGLAPGEHGFHVHTYGDLSDLTSGKSAGGHFAPRGSAHGLPDAKVRHVGDLGNVTADAKGHVTLDIDDALIELSGPHSILGRGVVVHSGADQGTQPSGDAGSRVALGVIGVANDAPTASDG